MNGRFDISKSVKFLGIPIIVWVWGAVALLAFIFRKKIASIISGVSAVASAQTEINEYHNSGNTAITITSVNPAQKAREAYDAIWGTPFGMWEDEKAFVEAIISVPKEFINAVAVEYAKIDSKGKILYNDAKKYLSATEYNKIKHLLS
jgi:hypothetical protein